MLQKSSVQSGSFKPLTSRPLIYLIEEHSRLRLLMEDFLKELPDLTVLGSASSIKEALLDSEFNKVNLVFIGLPLQGSKDTSFISELKQNNPERHIVILTSYPNPYFAQRGVVR